MKYALLIYADPDAREGAPEPGPEVIDSWIDYTAELSSAGAVLGAEQLRAADTATTVRSPAGERLLTDGPFMETKEHLLGFFLLDVPDLDTALDWAARMPIMRYGSVEVRPVEGGQAWRAPLE